MAKKLGAQLGGLARAANERLVRRLTATLNDAQDAEEVAQEAYVRLMKVRVRTDIADPAAFLHTTAHRLALDRLRQRKRAAKRQADLAQDAETATQAIDPERAAAARQQLDAVRDAINQLPDKCRQAFILHRFEGLSYPQIAKQLGVSVSMVEKYIIRALKACRQVRH